MPQVHNKSIAMERSVFGKNSRFMSTIRVSEGSKRKIRAFNTVETRLNRFRINFYTRHAEIQLNKRKREKDVVLENIKKRNAYKLVIRNHNFTNCTDHEKALNDRYNAHALRFEIKDMLKFMKPDRVRERKARELIEDNRKKYNQIIHRNRESITTLIPQETRRDSDDYSDDDFESDSEDEEETKKKQEQETASKQRATLSFQRQGVTKAFVLQSGRTEVDIKLPKESKTPRKETKSESKTDYELPPLVVKKQMDPSLKVST